MEVLDTTIANVALRYIAGGLSAPATDSEWVITSYLAANAIILPISGWLALRLGRRNYFLLSIAIFTLASALCGMATSLGVLIAFRVLQGLAGGGLQPSSQGVLLDAFPPEKQGQAHDALRHRRAARAGRRPDARRLHHRQLRLALDLLSQRARRPARARHVQRASSPIPTICKAQRAEAAQAARSLRHARPVLLSVTMVCWEILLSKGQEWDWFGDPFWRVQTLALLFVGWLCSG